MRRAMRNKGSGTIYAHPRKPSPWLQGEFHYTDEIGRRRRKYISGLKKTVIESDFRAFHAGVEARRALEEAKATGKPSDLDTGQYLDWWWSKVGDNYRGTTRDLHISTRGCHITPDTSFTKIPIEALTSKDVSAFLDRRKKAGASGHVLHRIHCLLRAAFTVGVELQQLRSNPARLPKMVRPKVPERKAEPFSPEDEAKLIAYVRGMPFWEALIITNLDSGCRQAELLGLRTDKVDLKRGVIYIHRSLNMIGGKPVLEEVLKNASSYRTIRLSGPTLNALQAQMPTTAGYVFSDDDGGPMERSKLWNRWEVLLRKAQVAHLKFHALRHTCATRLLRDGGYITAVSKRLGHKKVTITLNTYSFAIPEDDATLAESFAATLALYQEKSET